MVIHLLLGVYLHVFHFLAIEYCSLYMFWWEICFLSLGHMFRGGVAGSYGNSAGQFKELPGHYPSSLYKRSMRISYFCLILASSEGVLWYLNAVFICILVMTNDIFFHVLIGHVYIFFGQLPIHILCRFLN